MNEFKVRWLMLEIDCFEMSTQGAPSVYHIPCFVCPLEPVLGACPKVTSVDMVSFIGVQISRISSIENGDGDFCERYVLNIALSF